MTDTGQTVIDWRRSDYGQDNNTPLKVLMFSYGEQDILLNNVHDNVVSLINNSQEGDV